MTNATEMLKLAKKLEKELFRDPCADKKLVEQGTNCIRNERHLYGESGQRLILPRCSSCEAFWHAERLVAILRASVKIERAG